MSGFLTFDAVWKARLTAKVFFTKVNEFYNTWLRQQEDEVPEESRLKFLKRGFNGG